LLRRGHAFFTPEAPDAGVGRHVWFVLSDPAKSPQVVIANLSTLRPTNGHLGCTVKAREHPSVTRESVLRCDMARLQAATQIEDLLAKRVLQETTDASEALVLKLQLSLCDSSDTPNEVKAALDAQGIKPTPPAPTA
jgi:hypothetical protein